MLDSIRFDPIAEIDRYFDDSSLATSETPWAVLIAGGVAAGKTTLRRTKFATGYVVLDAAEIFLCLCQGKYLDFPGPIEEPMNWIGQGVAERIIQERRNFVTEVIGAEMDSLSDVIKAIRSAGYQIHFAGITCDTAAAVKRNANRGKNNISAYYTEQYHQRWILEAIGHGRVGAE
jgi:Zeta toxin